MPLSSVVHVAPSLQLGVRTRGGSTDRPVGEAGPVRTWMPITSPVISRVVSGHGPPRSHHPTLVAEPALHPREQFLTLSARVGSGGAPQR